MTTATVRAAAIALSALVSVGTVAAANGLATQQYAAADTQAMAQYGQRHVAIQHVVVVGRRTA